MDGSPAKQSGQTIGAGTDPTQGRVLIEASDLAHHLPITKVDPVTMSRRIPSEVQSASVGRESLEMRVYAGTDPDTGRPLGHAHFSRERADALRELKLLAAHANIAPAVGARMTVESGGHRGNRCIASEEFGQLHCRLRSSEVKTLGCLAFQPF